MEKTALILLAAVMMAVVFASTACGDGAPLLRVLLRRLSITDRLSLKLEGVFLLNTGAGTDLLLPDESTLSVECRNQELVVFYTGASFSAGSALTLVRQEDGTDRHGMFINDSAGFYPGDLSLSVTDGKIQPVLSIRMEDYLLGVVPYEMSDSFPLEALKAQAVCARTYAMKRMGGSGVWDVVDTTNDQVFKGVSEKNTNAARAVQDTAGIVITLNGQLAEGYYAASNGGQTELPSNVWGGDNYVRCYAIQDDPWDTANPDSVTRSYDFRKDGTGLYRRIEGLIRSAVFAEPEWQKGEFYQSDTGFRVDAFRSVSVKSPRYASPSRLMTELEITLDVSGRKVSGGTIGGFESAGTFTVTLAIFPDVVNALGLRIGSSGNEILTVSETADAFRLTSSRFGHGVGLSQRGAQWMAGHDGMAFDEILAFYFPGSELKKYTGEMAPLSVPPALLQTTPEPPAPVATPRPTLMPVSAGDLPAGAYLAEVAYIDDDSTLNLRQEPSPVAGIVMRLSKHQKLIVLDEMDVPGWALVRTDSVEGYVMRNYLERID